MSETTVEKSALDKLVELNSATLNFYKNIEKGISSLVQNSAELVDTSKIIADNRDDKHSSIWDRNSSGKIPKIPVIPVRIVGSDIKTEKEDQKPEIESQPTSLRGNNLFEKTLHYMFLMHQDLSKKKQEVKPEVKPRESSFIDKKNHFEEEEDLIYTDVHRIYMLLSKALKKGGAFGPQDEHPSKSTDDNHGDAFGSGILGGLLGMLGLKALSTKKPETPVDKEAPTETKTNEADEVESKKTIEPKAEKVTTGEIAERGIKEVTADSAVKSVTEKTGVISAEKLGSKAIAYAVPLLGDIALGALAAWDDPKKDANWRHRLGRGAAVAGGSLAGRVAGGALGTAVVPGLGTAVGEFSGSVGGAIGAEKWYDSDDKKDSVKPVEQKPVAESNYDKPLQDISDSTKLIQESVRNIEQSMNKLSFSGGERSEDKKQLYNLIYQPQSSESPTERPDIQDLHGQAKDKRSDFYPFK